MAGRGKGKGGEGSGDTPAARYDDELLSANWNPVIDLLEQSCARTLDTGRESREKLRDEDVDDFLGRVYQSGS